MGNVLDAQESADALGAFAIVVICKPEIVRVSANRNEAIRGLKIETERIIQA